MLGKLLYAEGDVLWDDPNQRNLVEEVSIEHPHLSRRAGKRRVILVDFGCKASILRCLLARDIDVLRVPWNFDWSQEEADGIVLSNGPGDPKICSDERMRHRSLPILFVQFHPEASPGPVNTGFVFDEFLTLLNRDR